MNRQVLHDCIIDALERKKDKKYVFIQFEQENLDYGLNLLAEQNYEPIHIERFTGSGMGNRFDKYEIIFKRLEDTEKELRKRLKQKINETTLNMLQTDKEETQRDLHIRKITLEEVFNMTGEQE